MQVRCFKHIILFWYFLFLLYAVSSFAHACLLKSSKVELTLISDPCLWNFFESSIRGGNSFVAKRLEKANNSYQKHPDHTKDFVHIDEYDVTNAYGGAMLQKMPTHVDWANKKWLKWLEREIFDNNCRNIGDHLDFSFYVEVSLHFPPKVAKKFRK